MLNALEKYFARVESVWKPVNTEESFKIVRRRLFEVIGDEPKRRLVCQSFAKMYQTQSKDFPEDTHNARYLERLENSYPIHPEIFDRLYEDWSTLEKFQRTRGVLQYMAIVIHRLWNSENKDLLIMPGSLPLFDGNVRTKSIHYLPQGWEPILEKEIDGEQAEASEIDGKETRFGALQSARRVTRTIFLGSAPSVDAQQARGIHYRRVYLGAVQPEQTIGIFEDVLKRLRDRLHYLYSNEERYWFDTRPNLRREMEERKRQFQADEHLLPLLRKEIEGIFRKTAIFAGVHIFASSGDIPDDLTDGVHLVILSPNQPFGKSDPHLFERPAEEILSNRGTQPRLRQNRLVYLAAEYETVNRLKDQARTYLAWQSIVTDVERMLLNLGTFQANQAKEDRENNLKSLRRMIMESYRHLVVPLQEKTRDGSMKLTWESVQIPMASTNVMQSIENKLVEEEWLTKEWAPLFLRNLLHQWYFRDDFVEVGAQRVWQDMGDYLYMPRLVSQQVFRNTLQKGVETKDYFAVADGKEGERYLGFAFGRSASIQLNGDTLFIEAEAAKMYSKPEPVPEPNPESGQDSRPEPIPSPAPNPTPPKARRFYGSVELAPISAKLDFATIVDEVLEQFTSRVGTQVKITIEIEAESDEGFGENQQRAVRENCGMLRFTNAEFPEQ